MFLLNLCSGKSVLHLGCSGSPDTIGRLQRGEHVHALLRPVTKDLYGVDRDEEGLKILKAHGYDNLFAGDVEQLDKVQIKRQFDVILMPEIIEHLGNPMLMLKGIRQFMRKDSLVCITRPNALSIKFFLHAFFGREMSEPDHVMIFSPITLWRLLERAGFETKETFGALEAHSIVVNAMGRKGFKIPFRQVPR